MRVLYVVHQFYPQFVSGTEQYVLALARAGRARGDDVRVFTLDPTFENQTPATELADYVHDGVPVTRYRFDKAAIRNYALTDWHNPEVGGPFRALLDELRPEVVHFFHLRWHGIDRFDDVSKRGIPFVVHLMDFWFVCPNFLLLRPGAELCAGPPDHGLGCFDCVYEHDGYLARNAGTMAVRARAERAEMPAHASDPQETALALMRRLPSLRDALARAACVLAPSATVRDLLLANGHRPRRLELAPYAVDWSLLDSLPAPRAEPIVIGFLGTLAPHKGADVLLEAFRAVDDRGVRLEIRGRFGDYPAFDQRLRELAGGDSRVAFRGGFPRAQLAEVLGGLHCVVVPSRWRENTPFVCLEARAAGVPLVASDVAGIAEAVPETRGTLFPPGDAGALRAALEATIEAARARGGGRLDADRSIPAIGEQFAELRALYAGLGA